MQAAHLAARVQEHHDLLERAVARALADAVDRAFDLPGPGDEAGVRVGDREAEVVVAVHGQDHVAHLGHEAVQAVEERGVLVGHRVADGVRDVDRRRAFLDRRGDDLGGVLELGARRVHRRELDVVDEGLRVRDRGAGLVQDVLAGRAELVDDVDVRRRDERVDARSLRVAYSSGGGLHVGRLSSSEAGDDRAIDFAGDRLDRFEVAGRGDREAGFDDVDAEAGELVRDLELLAGVQRDAGRLLAVAQRGVEDADVVRIDEAHDGVLLLVKVRGSLLLNRFAAVRPPRR